MMKFVNKIGMVVALGASMMACSDGGGSGGSGDPGDGGDEPVECPTGYLCADLLLPDDGVATPVSSVVISADTDQVVIARPPSVIWMPVAAPEFDGGEYRLEVPLDLLLLGEPSGELHVHVTAFGEDGTGTMPMPGDAVAVTDDVHDFDDAESVDVGVIELMPFPPQG